MIVLTWLACTSGTIVTTELPEGRVGDVYSAAIEADKRRKWVFTAEGLPPGLILNPSSGILSGVPEERAETTFTVQVATPNGNLKGEQDLTLNVLGPRNPNCGRTFTGDFSAASPFGDIAWDLDSWKLLELPLPGEEVEEISFETTGSIQLYAGLPGIDVVAGEATPFVDVWGLDFGENRIGWNTLPHLGALQASGRPLQLLVVAFGVGEWSIETACRASPVLESTGIGSFPVGQRAQGSFRATKYDEEIVVEALDPVPEGLELFESGGFDGIAEEAGLHRFNIRLTRTTTGAQTVAEVAIGVYEPITPECGETVRFETTSGRFALDAFPEAVNVDGFSVVEVPWADHTGLRFDLLLDDPKQADSADVRIIEPEARTVGDSLFGPWTDVVQSSPQTWPPASFYQVYPRFRLAISDFLSVAGELTLTCEDGPLPAETQLPLLAAGSPFETSLEAVGGTPPYLWSAAGLPKTVTLDGDGTLRSNGEDFGSAMIDVTLEDAMGRMTTTPLTLWSSVEAACDRVISCGATQTFEVASSSPQVVCVPPEDVLASDWVSYDVRYDGFGEPGLLEPGNFNPSETLARFTAYQGVLAATRGTGGTTFALERYDNRTWPLVATQGSGIDKWTVCAQCGTGLTPSNDELSCAD
ncbi:MAG: Ig domain-containing protein [Myxococcota bacterium]